MTDSKIFKIVLLGDTSTGKSSFIKNYISPTRHNTIKPTQGFQCLTISTANPTRWIQLWDTPGQQKYRMMPQAIIHLFDYALVFYDVTNKHTLRVASEIIKNISMYNPMMQIILIGNKADIAIYNQSKRQVRIEEGAEVAKSLGVNFIEYSFEERAENLIKKLFDSKWSTIKTENPNDIKLKSTEQQAQCRTCV